MRIRIRNKALITDEIIKKDEAIAYQDPRSKDFTQQNHYYKCVHSRAYNVDVSKVGIALCEHAGLCWLGPDIPNFDCTVARARGHHVLLVRGPPEKQEIYL
jgi:hypothetical protein